MAVYSKSPHAVLVMDMNTKEGEEFLCYMYPRAPQHPLEKFKGMFVAAVGVAEKVLKDEISIMTLHPRDAESTSLSEYAKSIHSEATSAATAPPPEPDMPKIQSVSKMDLAKARIIGKTSSTTVPFDPQEPPNIPSDRLSAEMDTSGHIKVAYWRDLSSNQQQQQPNGSPNRGPANKSPPGRVVIALALPERHSDAVCISMLHDAIGLLQFLIPDVGDALVTWGPEKLNQKLDPIFQSFFRRFFRGIDPRQPFLSTFLTGYTYYPCSREVQEAVDAELTTLECSPNTDVSELCPHPRPMSIVGTCLLHKGCLIQSHMRANHTKEVSRFLHHMDLLNRTKDSPEISIVEKVFITEPHNPTRFVPHAAPFPPTPSTMRKRLGSTFRYSQSPRSSPALSSSSPRVGSFLLSGSAFGSFFGRSKTSQQQQPHANSQSFHSFSTASPTTLFDSPQKTMPNMTTVLSEPEHSDHVRCQPIMILRHATERMLQRMPSAAASTLHSPFILRNRDRSGSSMSVGGPPLPPAAATGTASPRTELSVPASPVRRRSLPPKSRPSLTISTAQSAEATLDFANNSKPPLGPASVRESNTTSLLSHALASLEDTTCLEDMNATEPQPTATPPVLSPLSASFPPLRTTLMGMSDSSGSGGLHHPSTPISRSVTTPTATTRQISSIRDARDLSELKEGWALDSPTSSPLMTADDILTTVRDAMAKERQQKRLLAENRDFGRTVAESGSDSGSPVLVRPPRIDTTSQSQSQDDRRGIPIPLSSTASQDRHASNLLDAFNDSDSDHSSSGGNLLHSLLRRTSSSDGGGSDSGGFESIRRVQSFVLNHSADSGSGGGTSTRTSEFYLVVLASESNVLCALLQSQLPIGGHPNPYYMEELRACLSRLKSSRAFDEIDRNLLSPNPPLADPHQVTMFAKMRAKQAPLPTPSSSMMLRNQFCLTEGPYNTLFHYVFFSRNSGALLLPAFLMQSLCHNLSASVKMGHLQLKFVQACDKIREVLSKNRQATRSSKAPPAHTRRLASSVCEYGIRLEDVFEEGKDGVLLNCWVIGRLLPQVGEFYVLFHDSIPQNVVEMAFKMQASMPP